MKNRKTYEVEALTVRINRRLADKATLPVVRKELAALLSAVLHATGNYHGFNYLDWLETGHQDWVDAGKPSDTAPFLGDQTRVVFFGRASIMDPKLDRKSYPSYPLMHSGTDPA